jgi:hypothetical protein
MLRVAASLASHEAAAGGIGFVVFHSLVHLFVADLEHAVSQPGKQIMAVIGLGAPRANAVGEIWPRGFGSVARPTPLNVSRRGAVYHAPSRASTPCRH